MADRLLYRSLLGSSAGRDARGRKVLRPTVRVPTWEQPMLIALTGGIRRRGHSHESIRERDARACSGTQSRKASSGVDGVEATIPMSIVSGSAGTGGRRL